MSRSVRVPIRLSPEEKLEWEEFAKKAGYPGVSEMVREAVEALIERETMPAFEPIRVEGER